MDFFLLDDFVYFASWHGTLIELSSFFLSFHFLKRNYYSETETECLRRESREGAPNKRGKKPVLPMFLKRRL